MNSHKYYNLDSCKYGFQATNKTPAKHGVEDLDEAKRLCKKMKRMFGVFVKIDIFTIDEWVSLQITRL